MEYAKIVLKQIGTGRIISNTIVLPKPMAELEYVKLLSSPTQRILDEFSITEIVPCLKEEFNVHNFDLYLKLSSNEIGVDEYQSQIQLQ